MLISLFIGCYNDTLFPETGKAVVTVLERLGHTVEFREAQTCCGQMHYNTGYARGGAAADAALSRRLRRCRGDLRAVGLLRRDDAGALSEDGRGDAATPALIGARRGAAAAGLRVHRAAGRQAGRDRRRRVLSASRDAAHLLSFAALAAARGPAGAAAARGARPAAHRPAALRRVLRLRRHVRGQERRRLHRDGGRQGRRRARDRRRRLHGGRQLLPDADWRRCWRASRPAGAACTSPRSWRRPTRPAAADDPRRPRRRRAGVPGRRARTRSATSSCATNVRHATDVIRGKRALVVGETADWQQLREAGRQIKAHVLRHLDGYLEQFEEHCTRAGGHVHWARDADEANRLIVGIIQSHGETRGHQGQDDDLGRDPAQRRARSGRHHAVRDRPRRSHHPARSRPAVAHRRAGAAPQPRRDPRAVPADDEPRRAGPGAGGSGARGAAVPAREVPAREGRVQRRQLRARRHRRRLRRRVRGQRPDVRDAAARARHAGRDREDRPVDGAISRCSCSCCRARRPASG